MKSHFEIDLNQHLPVLESFRDQFGTPFKNCLERNRALVVFLRHSGCIFCRQNLQLLTKLKDNFNESYTSLVIVGMASPQKIEQLAKEFHLPGASWISDPKKELYRAFGLYGYSLSELFGPKVWAQGFKAMVEGHWFGKIEEDVAQMSGTFLFVEGKLDKQWIPEYVGEGFELKEIFENWKKEP